MSPPEAIGREDRSGVDPCQPPLDDRPIRVPEIAAFARPIRAERVGTLGGRGPADDDFAPVRLV